MAELGLEWQGPFSQPLPCMTDPDQWRVETPEPAPFNNSFSEALFFSTKLQKHIDLAKAKVSEYLAKKEKAEKYLERAKNAVDNVKTIAANLADSKDPDDLSKA